MGAVSLPSHSPFLMNNSRLLVAKHITSAVSRHSRSRKGLCHTADNRLKPDTCKIDGRLASA
jgi:hypothetical protein